MNILKGEHHLEAYAKLNPSHFVPTLIVKDPKLSTEPLVLCESLPICEFIEEAYPERRKLIPSDLIKR